MAKHIFISHSKKDSEFINKLEKNLEQLGFRTWIDTDISGGEEWRNMIDKNLRNASDVVVVLSPNAVASRWVVHETAIAIGAGINVVPIMIKEVPPKEIPVFAEEKQWIDFLGWEDEEKYQAALAKLSKAITPPNPIQDLLEQSVQAYLQTGELLGDSLLGYIEENLAKVKLGETAAVLLEKSKQRRDQAQRIKIRNQRLLQGGVVVLSILTVAAILLSIFSFTQTNNLRASEATSEARAQEAEEARALEQEQRILAEEAQRVSEEQASLAIAGELAANAASLVENDPELGILLTIESLRERYTVQAEELLRRLLVASRLRTVFTPHQGQQVNIVRYSPDGNYIFTAGDDNAARVWDTNTGSLTQEFVDFNGAVTQASFSESGRSVITISEDQGVQIWSVDSGQVEFVFGGSISSISPDGQFIIGVDSIINVTLIWNVEPFRLVRSFENEGEVSNVSISNEGKYAILMDKEYQGKIWDVERDSLIGSIQGEVLAFNSDGYSVLTAWELPQLALYNLANGELVYKITVDGYISDIGASFSPNGQWIIVWPIDELNLNQVAYIWYASNGRLRTPLLGHRGDIKVAEFIDKDQTYVITGSVDNNLRMWNIYTSDSVLVLSGHTEDVIDIAVNPDGSRIATSSLDGTVRTWDITTAKSQVVGNALSAKFGPDNTLALNSEDGNVSVYSITPNGISEPIIYENAISRYGRWVIQGINEDTLQILKASTGEIIGQVGPFEDEFSPPAISPNGKYLIVNQQIWDVESGKHISDLGAYVERFNGRYSGVEYFSPDSKLIALPASDFSIRIWELASGKVRSLLIGHNNAIESVAFSPDGSLLVSTSDDNTAKVWDVETGHLLTTLGDSLGLYMIAANFSPDGKNVLIGDWNGKVQIFEARTGNLLKNYVGHNGYIISAAFSLDGKYIITSSGEGLLSDYTTRIWDANTGQILYFRYGNFMGVNNASFSENGLWAVAIENGEAYLYLCEVCVPYQEMIQLAEARLSILGRDLSCQEEQKYLHKDIECAIPPQNP